MEGETRKKKNKTNWPMTIGITLVLTAIAISICLAVSMQGETKIVGDWPELESPKSLSCEAEGVAYPFFMYDNSEKKITKVNAVFNGNDLDRISLVYSLYYGDEDQIVKSEAENHAAMNLQMQDEGLGPDAFSANYARLTDRLKMSLYAEAKKLNSSTVKYFELDWVESGIYDMGIMEKIYVKKGFNCIVNEG